MKKLVGALGALVLLGAGIGAYLYLDKKEPETFLPEGFVGSSSCKSCHERFYELWAPSHHGLAMQPYSRELARKGS